MTVFILPKEDIFVPNIKIECTCPLLVFLGRKKKKKRKKLEKRNVKGSQEKTNKNQN